MVENGRLGRSRSTEVVVARDGVQELGAQERIEPAGMLFDQTKTEMYVPEQPPLVRRPEGGRGAKLPRSTDVVEECGCEDEIGSQPAMQRRGVPA